MIDACDCDEGRLRDQDLVREICEAVIADLGLKVIGDPQEHRFPGPGGVTTLYMLSESHLACHTYPEHRIATFNLYCCRARPPWDWRGQLESSLAARSVLVRQFERGQRDVPDGNMKRAPFGDDG